MGRAPVFSRIQLICFAIAALLAASSYSVAKHHAWWLAALVAITLAILSLHRRAQWPIRLLISFGMAAFTLSLFDNLSPIAFIGAVGIAAFHLAGTLVMEDNTRKMASETADSPTS